MVVAVDLALEASLVDDACSVDPEAVFACEEVGIDFAVDTAWEEIPHRIDEEARSDMEERKVGH